MADIIQKLDCAMECLPVEITDRIFDKLYWENPYEVYDHRRVSRAWKSIIDNCTGRQLKIWGTKCADSIKKVHLDDIIRIKYPQFLSWDDYYSKEMPMPHIARKIYESKNEFPHLIHKEVQLTEVCSAREIKDRQICSYALNDNYFAISLQSANLNANVVRVYAINDLNHCIQEYPFACAKMDFYHMDNEAYIILQEISDNPNERKSVCLSRFLVNNDLIPANLPLDPVAFTLDYAVVKNHCFTFTDRVHWLRHEKLTPSGFETVATIPVPPAENTLRKFLKIEMCNSELLVSVFVVERSVGMLMISVYRYEITEEADNRLAFSDPKVYQQNIIVPRENMMQTISVYAKLKINFAADNIPLEHSVCDLHPRDLETWVKRVFDEIHIYSYSAYAHHVLMVCHDNIIIFRGNLQELMSYVLEDKNPGSKCTAINLSSSGKFEVGHRYMVHVIRNESEAKFLIVSQDKVFRIDLTL